MALLPFVDSPLTELFTLHPMVYDHCDELWSPFDHFWPFAIRRPNLQKRQIWHEKVPLHGLPPENCKVTRQGRTITVNGQSKNDDGEVSFTRRVQVPETIDESTVEWEFTSSHGGYLVIKGMTPEPKAEKAVTQLDPNKPFRLQMGCAGIDPRKIKVKLDNRVLTIEGAEEIQGDGGTVMKRSILERVLLPTSVDLATIKPTISNGQLTVEAKRLPPAASSPPTEVPVQIEDKME